MVPKPQFWYPPPRFESQHAVPPFRALWGLGCPNKDWVRYPSHWLEIDDALGFPGRENQFQGPGTKGLFLLNPTQGSIKPLKALSNLNLAPKRFYTT